MRVIIDETRVSSEIGDASKISRPSLSFLTKLYVLSFSAETKAFMRHDRGTRRIG